MIPLLYIVAHCMLDKNTKKKYFCICEICCM